MNTRISLWVTDTGRWKKHRSQAFKEILDETNGESRRDAWNRLKPFYDEIINSDEDEDGKHRVRHINDMSYITGGINQ